jgi:hypothetical protein
MLHSPLYAGAYAYDVAGWTRASNDLAKPAQAGV